MPLLLCEKIQKTLDSRLDKSSKGIVAIFLFLFLRIKLYMIRTIKTLEASFHSVIASMYFTYIFRFGKETDR